MRRRRELMSVEGRRLQAVRLEELWRGRRLVRMRGGHGIEVAQGLLLEERGVVLIALLSGRGKKREVTVVEIRREIVLLRLGVEGDGGVGPGGRLLSEARAGIKAVCRVDGVGLCTEEAVCAEGVVIGMQRSCECSLLLLLKSLLLLLLLLQLLLLLLLL